MEVTRISCKNFRSFGSFDVQLSSFNVIVGANSSGKSNFFQLFKFLQDWQRHDLDTAVALQGGVEYLKNYNSDKKSKVEVRIELEAGQRELQFRPYVIGSAKNQPRRIYVQKLTFSAVLAFPNKTKCESISEEIRMDLSDENRVDHVAQVILSSGLDKVSIVSKSEDADLKQDLDKLQGYVEDAGGGALLSSFALWMILRRQSIIDFGMYDFDVKLPKRASQLTGRSELEEDGHNLAVVLKRISRDSQQKKAFLRYLSDVLPFYSDFKTQSLTDKTFIFQLREKFQKKPFVPASFLSDGTINITLMIVALFFERKNIRFFEEPERNIHPYLIANVVEMMKSGSTRKQVFVSTHNPIFVRNAEIKDLLLISRDHETGVSTVSKPEESSDVASFLKRDLGIDDLFVQNLL
jgi:predicted ATPase